MSHRFSQAVLLIFCASLSILVNQNCSAPFSPAQMGGAASDQRNLDSPEAELEGSFFTYKDAKADFSLYAISARDWLVYDYALPGMQRARAEGASVELSGGVSLNGLQLVSEGESVLLRFTVVQAGANRAVELSGFRSADRRRAPIGQIFSHDGDFLFETAESSEYNPGAYTRQLARTSFDTVSVNAFSGVRYYYSGKAAEQGRTFGFRPFDDGRVRQARALFDAGRDPLGEFAAAAKAAGKKFVLDFRIADAHYAETDHPEKFPWTPAILAGRISAGQPILDLTIGADQIVSSENHSRLLDFAAQAVRDEILNEMLLSIERYSSVLDGFQIDFTRYPVLFKYRKGVAERDKLTEMVAVVRRKLDQVERDAGRPISLIVRVSPSLAGNINSGIDVFRWQSLKLVDAVVPSPVMALRDNFDPEMSELSVGTKTQLFASLMGRMPYGNYTMEDIHGDVRVNSASASFWRSPAEGFIRNAQARGLTHFEVYNWQFDDLRLGYLDTIFHPERAAPEYLFSVPRMYYSSSIERFYQDPVLALPAILEPGATREFKLQAYLERAEMEDRLVTLRIGWTDDPMPNRVVVKLNGRDLGLYALNDSTAPEGNMVSVTGEGYFRGAAQGGDWLFYDPHDLAATKYMYFTGLSARDVVRGLNSIAIKPAQRVGILSIDLMIR